MSKLVYNLILVFLSVLTSMCLTACTATVTPRPALSNPPYPSCSAYKIHLAYSGVSYPKATQSYVTKLDAIVGGLTEDQRKAIVRIIEAANEENAAWKKANAGNEDKFPQSAYLVKMPEPLAKICEKRDASIAAVLTEKQHLAFGRSQMIGHLRTNIAYNHALTADQMEAIEARAGQAIVALRLDGKLPVQYLRMAPHIRKMYEDVLRLYGQKAATEPAAQTQASAPTSRPGQLADIWINYDSPFVHGSLYSARMSQGDTVTLTLIGRDDGWKWFHLPARKIEWKASPEVEITPVLGSVVKARIVRPITTLAYVSAETVSDDGRNLRVFYYIAPKKQP